MAWVLEQEHERLREEIERTRERRDRYHEQLLDLAGALAEARAALSEAIIVGQCTARPSQVLGKIRPALAERRAST